MYKALRRRWRRLRRSLRVIRLRRLWRPRLSPRHDLPVELIVSLTSYPKRFDTLDLTLKTLMSQSVRPDRLILWIDPRHVPLLPKAVTDLTRHGLAIEACEDLRAYTKLIPALRRYPAAAIVTADDDIAYPRRWLEALTEDYRGDVITFHRCHRPRREADGSLAPYRSWEQNLPVAEPDAEVFPTGVGGILYPPGVLSDEVLDQATFQDLCPLADDIWFYWMGRRAGARYRKVGRVFKLVSWPGSQAQALLHQNVDQDANDAQIRQMTERFGPWPPLVAAGPST
jgi:hypothetical protein